MASDAVRCVERRTEDKSLGKMSSNSGLPEVGFYKLPPLCFAEVDIMGEGQAERSGDTERLMEMEQTLSSLTEMKKTDGMALWRQQTCAIAKVRLLKLKHERKALLSV